MENLYGVLTRFNQRQNLSANHEARTVALGGNVKEIDDGNELQSMLEGPADVRQKFSPWNGISGISALGSIKPGSRKKIQIAYTSDEYFGSTNLGQKFINRLHQELPKGRKKG